MYDELTEKLEERQIEVESQKVEDIDYSNGTGKTAPEF